MASGRLTISMACLLAALDASLHEHRRCEDFDGGAHPGRVWLTCAGGARIVHPTDGPLNIPVLRGPKEQ